MFKLLCSFSSVLLLLVTVSASTEYEVKPLKLGVQVEGIKLMDHVNDSALFEKIRHDAYKHRLMLFRNQGEIPPEMLVKMFQSFGAIDNIAHTHTKNLIDGRLPVEGAVVRLSNDATKGRIGVGTQGWHQDGVYKPIPYGFLVFNSIKAPIVGDTKLVGHREVLNSMPKKMLEYLDRLWIVNNRHVWTVKGDKSVVDEELQMIHPLIYNHPATNESVLCVNLGYMRGAIYDYNRTTERVLTNRELLDLKSLIYHGITKDNERLVYSHKWQDGDLVIIDNLQLIHVPSKESQMPKEKVGVRIIQRLPIQGFEKPAKKTPITLI